MKRYDPSSIEPKWQEVWQATGLYQVTGDNTRKPYYYLMEFPYPSGEGLHVGHVRGFTALDIMARLKRMQGFDVLYPIGFDAFGLPTENYAIKHKIAPQAATDINVANFRRQFKALGLSFDWSREVITTDPAYYRWTQWIFLKFFQAGLAYQAEMPINWCPFEKTGLANEEVVNGVHERCGTAVEKKLMKQWMLKITAYADRLIDDLASVDYLDRISSQQINWIGRSHGAEISFTMKSQDNFVLLHGFQGNSRSDFFPWLKAQLPQADTYVPDMLCTDNPQADVQASFVLQNYHVDDKTVLFGHSFGAVTALRILENLDTPIKRLVLAAGFAQPGFLDHSRVFDTTNSWNFDFEKIRSNVLDVIILRDLTDSAVSPDRAEYLKRMLGGRLIDVQAEGDHFSGAIEPSILSSLIDSIRVYTTRPDTLFGATFIAVSPELVQTWIAGGWKAASDVHTYVERALNLSELSRQEDKTKTGVDTGIRAVHPLSGEELPVWVADYVLGGYGTGAIMAVPAHDQRDFEFATAFGLPVKTVVEPVTGTPQTDPEHRQSIVAIVQNKAGELLSINWGKDGGYLFVGGGRDQDEDAEACARREVLEETGYADLKLTATSETVHHNYYAHSKKQSRAIEAVGFLFELETDKVVKPKLEADEVGKFTVEWLSLEAAERQVTDPLHAYLLRKFVRGQVYTGYGPLTASATFDGLSGQEARDAVVKALTEAGRGKLATKFKLRDWIFSRQHYWGEPIPIIHCKTCGPVAVPEDQLPVTLPVVSSYEPTDTGESPLAAMTDWVNVDCPTCGKPAKRETDTMPNWAGSSWYYLRYLDPHNASAFAGPEQLAAWTPVDLYNGGMEHTTLHLLYSRFWHKFLYDQGLVPTSEPYARRRSHGMILGPDGVKMSKSRGNVINPDSVIERYGADAVRVYEMFMGPFDEQTSWSDERLSGVSRFVYRVWTLVQNLIEGPFTKAVSTGYEVSLGIFETEINRAVHKTLKKVHEDIEGMQFNTAVSALMELVNLLTKATSKQRLLQDNAAALRESTLRQLVLMTAPMMPHVAEELWQDIGGTGSVHVAPWPAYDPALIKDDMVTVVVQINGKLRASLLLPVDANEADVVAAAKADGNVLKYLSQGTIRKTVFVPRKLVNFVVT